MIRQLVLLNAGIYLGGYLLTSGPIKQQYRRFMTIDSNSSVLSLLTAHFGHTSMPSLLFNMSVLWTLGHYTATKYGCQKFVMIAGVSMALGSVFAAAQSRQTPGQSLAGGSAISAGLITYNAIQNPHFFRFLRLGGAAPLGLLTLYSVYGKDAASFGGISGGALALLFL
uniref:Peptidase S54 rhomboid domain-containing protein n=1 Tax=Strombidium rassoulzadegani TaxID=1082188 RepID=A0A7S3FS30_9SPIT|mmetsp:Transcript_12720/g.21437  ORF Transcript_12720/g.21437 Transcript_12720/m.21437 type:complete len:169 (+) Transcript_12720:139-645(+)